MIQMKKNAFLWFSAGLLFSLLALLLVWSGLSGSVMVTEPEEIPKAADTILQCIQSGDWSCLESMVQGHPSLAPVTGETESPEEVIWNAYQKNLHWTIHENFQIKNALVAQKITVSCLDIPGVAAEVNRILADANIHLSESEYHDQILNAVVNQILETEPPLTEHNITLSFLREEGRWLALPDSSLQALLAGFTDR